MTVITTQIGVYRWVVTTSTVKVYRNQYDMQIVGLVLCKRDLNIFRDSSFGYLGYCENGSVLTATKEERLREVIDCCTLGHNREADAISILG